MAAHGCEVQVVRKLGQGGFGEAFLVKKNSEYLVLKKVNLGFMNAEDRVHQMQEAKLLKNLSHDHIVSYKGCHLSDRTLNIFMEYCEAGDLGDLISRRGGRCFREETVSIWLRQLASVLQYIHGLNVLHRDLKPQNIFLCSGNRSLKVGDFGLAKVLAHGQFAQTCAGTWIYKAPEVCHLPYTNKADMYSLGATLLHITTLNLPRPGLEPPMCYSATLRHLIRNLMAQQPQNRPSARDIVDLLTGGNH